MGNAFDGNLKLNFHLIAIDGEGRSLGEGGIDFLKAKKIKRVHEVTMNSVVKALLMSLIRALLKH